MNHPVLHLEALRTLTHPKTANIFEIIAESDHVTFLGLKKQTKLSTDGLAKHLNQLFDNYLIKIIMSKEGENYTKYILTRKGESFHKILHNVLVDLGKIPSRYETNKFVIDATGFWKLIEKSGVTKIAHLFRNSKIVLTNSDFSKILEMNEENNDLCLEEFLYSDELIEVPRTYNDSENGIMTEFYLRRSLRLEKDDAEAVALAADLDASLISDNSKILQAAKRLGILCIDLQSVIEMDPKKPIAKQIYEKANKKYDPSDIEFLIQKSSVEIVKKNYD